MFDRAGKRLVWASNRNASSPSDLNLFMAEWIEKANSTESEDDEDDSEEVNRTKVSKNGHNCTVLYYWLPQMSHAIGLYSLGWQFIQVQFAYFHCSNIFYRLSHYRKQQSGYSYLLTIDQMCEILSWLLLTSRICGAYDIPQHRCWSLLESCVICYYFLVSYFLNRTLFFADELISNE